MNSKDFFEDAVATNLANSLLLREDNTVGDFKFSSPWKITFRSDVPKIKDVIFNHPATIVIWEDGTKTVVKTQNNESFDKEKGLAMAISKKAMGNKGNYNEVFKKWCD